jgi:hypothetical protein
MKTYKAISLKQPWADMVVEGKKTVETRKWNTKYRGDLVICSSAKPTGIGVTGCALGIVEIYDARPMQKKDEKKACIAVYPKAHGWFLQNIRRITKPIPVKGQLGIFTVQLPRFTTRRIG